MIGFNDEEVEESMSKITQILTKIDSNSDKKVFIKSVSKLILIKIKIFF